MLNVIEGAESQKWNNIVKSFNDWDVYYLSEYAASFSLHGDGSPLLIHYQDSSVEICYSVMKEDIADLSYFSGALERGTYFDLSSPYGYGGPLIKGIMRQDSVDNFKKELFEFCNDERIVSQFLRFHPLLDNHQALGDICETRYIHDTIYIDLSSPEIIWLNMDSKNRNMIRKAIGNGITIEQRSIEDIAGFVDVYVETMLRDRAAEYYFFGDAFFESLANMESNSTVFYALRDGRIIGATIIMFNDRYMHYHLSGTLNSCRNLGSNNLLLYEAALWGNAIGLEKFHLGGGITVDDGLFSFKKKFNKNGRIPFVVGRTIFNQSGYDRLKVIRKTRDENFDMDNSFLIQYRK